MGFFDSLKSVGKSLIGGLAPIAGSVLGSRLGGAGGGQLGSALGSMVSNVINKPSMPAQRPQAPQGLGQQFSGMANQAANQYLPQQLQNQNFGQMAQSLQGMAGNALNQFLGPEAGQSGLGQALTGALGNFLGNRFGGMMPQGWQNQSFGSLAQQGGDYLQGMAPQAGAGGGGGMNFQQMGTNMMNQYMPQEFQQAGVGNALMNAFGNYAQNRFPQFSGMMGGMGGGADQMGGMGQMGIPQAPPMGPQMGIPQAPPMTPGYGGYSGYGQGFAGGGLVGGSPGSKWFMHRPGLREMVEAVPVV